MPAKPGVDYSFDKLDFEIRETIPSLSYRMSTTWKTFMQYMAVLSFFAALLAFILYIYQTIKVRH